ERYAIVEHKHPSNRSAEVQGVTAGSRPHILAQADAERVMTRWMSEWVPLSLAIQPRIIPGRYDGSKQNFGDHSLAGASGNATENSVPLFSSLRTSIAPLCSWMIRRVIARPSPVPSGLVVKKGSNRWERFSGGMPAPESLTVTQI